MSFSLQEYINEWRERRQEIGTRLSTADQIKQMLRAKTVWPTRRPSWKGANGLQNFSLIYGQ